jgi:hypothetical protein
MAMCMVCRRTLLTGESFRTWRAHRRDQTVCAPCEPAALRDGWLRLERPLETVNANGLLQTVRRVA